MATVYGYQWLNCVYRMKENETRESLARPNRGKELVWWVDDCVLSSTPAETIVALQQWLREDDFFGQANNRREEGTTKVVATLHLVANAEPILHGLTERHLESVQTFFASKGLTVTRHEIYTAKPYFTFKWYRVLV
jgi:hypothetical protein